MGLDLSHINLYLFVILDKRKLGVVLPQVQKSTNITYNFCYHGSQTFSTQLWLRDSQVFSSCCILLIMKKARKYSKQICFEKIFVDFLDQE